MGKQGERVVKREGEMGCSAGVESEQLQWAVLEWASRGAPQPPQTTRQSTIVTTYH